MQQQKIVHTYGDNEDDEFDEQTALREAEARLMENPQRRQMVTKAVAPPKGAKVGIGGKKCRCGSRTHVRISHSSCPLNKSNAAKEQDKL